MNFIYHHQHYIEVQNVKNYIEVQNVKNLC